MATYTAKEKKDKAQEAFDTFHSTMVRHASAHRFVERKERELEEAKESLTEVQEDLVEAREALYRACPELTMEVNELLSDPAERDVDED